MYLQKKITSPDGEKAYLVFGSEEAAKNFCLSQLYSGELFPTREYYETKDEDVPYLLSAKHVSKDREIEVLVYTANN